MLAKTIKQVGLLHIFMLQFVRLPDCLHWIKASLYVMTTLPWLSTRTCLTGRQKLRIKISKEPGYL